MRLATIGKLAFVLAIVGLSIEPARANGRFPVTNGVYFGPDDARSIYIRTTFGLLVSHDDGCSFRWVCEQNIGYNGIFDPSYAIAKDGALFATTYGGVRVSRDGGCTFTTATADLPAGDPGRIADLYVAAIDIATNGEIWVTSADSGRPNDVYRSTDNGVTFSPRGLGSSSSRWHSVVVAPSDAMHVYVAGEESATAADATASATPHVRTTTTGGTSWDEASLAGVQLGSSPSVSVVAVDPQDPQRVYLVSKASSGSDGDRLYRSTDGGMAFTEVLATTQPINSVVVRDATTVIVSSGIGGTYRSDDRGVSFAPIATAPQLDCLGLRDDGALIGCGANWDPDFMAVARSANTSQWEKVFRFIEIDGPVTCPVGTPNRDVCEAQAWPAIASQFGATGPSCPTATDFPPSTVDSTSPTPGGCCDVGGRSPFGSILVALMIAWPLPKRRRA